jgi:uncharacterized cofD-like protein
MVVIGPGSLFTTVLAALLTDGLAEALRETTAQVVYIANNTTQTGQTDQLRMIDHVERVVDLLGSGTLNTVLINQSPYDPVAMQPYEAEGLFLLQPDPSEIARVEALGVRVLVRELAEPIGQKRALWNKQDTVRHNPAAIRAALVELLG